MVEKKLLTAYELAEILDLSLDTIWHYTREDRIPHIEVEPGQYRYFETDVFQILQKRAPAHQSQISPHTLAET
ncbi:MAG: helix-turn-helix domain-containing protein [Limnochordia bacterium]|nr:helix-turn-helix domain-containing protein [Limnochordia bacterium]